MKVSKIPGLGRFGVFVDDVDFTTMNDDQWNEIGNLYLNELVVIIRNVNLPPEDMQQWIRKFGPNRDIIKYNMCKKYNTNYRDIIRNSQENPDFFDDDDKLMLKTLGSMQEKTDKGMLMRVSGQRDDRGKPLGMFAEGELLWHSNEAGTLTFTPGVALYAYENVVGSSTGFLTTTDYYENVSESFRSELDEMVLIHTYQKGAINPGHLEEQELITQKVFCPVDNIEIPMVIQSPGGIKGLHYSVNTVSQIKGMTIDESRKVFEEINRNLFVDEYLYDHWYKNDKDLLLFDNSIALHRRLGDVKNRLCYRIQHDLNNLHNNFYEPFFQDPWKTEHRKIMEDFVNVLDLKGYHI